jgi:polar amino acid transport system substrate-binding protein
MFACLLSRSYRNERLVTMLAPVLIALFALTASPRAFAQSTTVQWLGGELPPYMWQENNAAQGYGADIIRAIAEKLGRPAQIDFFPWARAVTMAREGKNMAILPLTRSPERETQYQWLILLDHIKQGFFVRPTDPMGALPAFANDLNALRQKRVGVLRGSPLVKRLQNEQFVSIIEDTAYIDLLRQLERGSIDAIYAAQPMLSSAIPKLGYPAGYFAMGIGMGEADTYIGFSLKLDAAEQDAILKAYAALERNGTINKLRNKHNLPRLP